MSRSTFRVAVRVQDRVPCIYLREFKCVVAEFLPGSSGAAEVIGTLLELDAKQPNFEQTVAEYLQWVRDTFEGETVAAQTKHLKEEFREMLAEPKKPDEYADVLMLMLCIASAHGVDLVKAFHDKFAINKERKWEKTDRGWRHVKAENNAI